MPADVHVAIVNDAAGVLATHVADTVARVKLDVAKYLRDTLALSTGGLVESTQGNVAIIGGLGSFFVSAMQRNGYGMAIDEFILVFGREVDAFFSYFNDLRRRVEGLPDVSFDPIDKDLLAGQAQAAVISLNGLLLDAAADIRARTSFSTVNIGIEDVILFVHDGMRKMNRVEQMAKDLGLLFFRLICSVAYARIERSEVSLQYEYAGDAGVNTRPFCQSLLSSGRLFRRDEIDTMDNGQLPGVFITAGGHACVHWWSVGEAT